MATYAIGDIHGCLRTLDNLLAHIGFSPSSDTLWLTGDLVNRGPDSAGVLRRVHSLRHCVKCVLGNHDLHLLAAHLNLKKVPRELQSLFTQPDCDSLCNWLKTLPLMHIEDDYVLLHAGRLPEWQQSQTEELAREAEEAMQADDNFFAEMYGDFPARWHTALGGEERRRIIINAFTRMRILSASGEMIFPYTGPPQERPAGTVPWFDFPGRKRWSSTIICGHWSSLGLLIRPDIAAIDTGCLWGRSLTAMRLEDRKIFQVPAHAEDAVQ